MTNDKNNDEKECDTESSKNSAKEDSEKDKKNWRFALEHSPIKKADAETQTLISKKRQRAPLRKIKKQ